jgi:hypothetical protein
MTVRTAHLVAGLMLATTLALALPRAEAYRPFISTDAAVADPKELEIELGYFTLRRERRENTFLIPSAVLNYGFWRNLELVGEFRVARAPSGDVDVVDPAVFVKAVIKEGVLQEHDGVGVAIEAGPLLPSTVQGDHGAGFEAIGIVSGRVAPFTIHVNVGGGIERSAAKPFGVWGVIGELPVHPRLRVVGEVAGESVQGEPANNSALLGVIWQPSSRNVYWDVAVRRGITRGAPDWEVTTGVTFGFVLPFTRTKPGAAW